MQGTQERLSSILSILADHPEGRMVKDIASEIGLNRNAVAQYLGILFHQGRVDIRHVGKAKVFTLSQRVPFSLFAGLYPGFILGIDRNLLCVDASAGFCAWAGCSAGQIRNQPLRAIDIPLFRQHPPESLARAGILAVTEPVKFSCDRPDGTEYYELHCVPVVFSDYTTGTALIIRDITFAETASERIALLEERYRAVTVAQTEYIVQSLPDGTILFANPAYAAVAGVPAGQLVGKKYRPKLPQEDEARAAWMSITLTSENPEYTVEHRILVPSGDFRWVRWRHRGIFRNGVLAEIHTHGTDITELRTTQKRLQFYHENAEAMVNEKTEELIRINRDLLLEIQKRKQIERNLQRTQFSVNNASDLIVWTDECGSIASCNKSALNILGCAPGQFLRLFTPPGANGTGRLMAWPEIWEPVKQNGFFLFEAIMQDRAGQEHCMEVLGNYLIFEESESCCFFIRDITERKQAEERLRLLTISVENAYDEVLWMDLNGRFLYVNDATCQATGYSREELLAMTINELAPAIDSRMWEEHVADLRKNKKQFFASRHRRKDGTLMDVEIASVYVKRSDKEQKICFVRDITERLKMEQTLRESRELFAAAFYNGPLVVTISDLATWCYLDVNEQFTRLFGYTREEVLGRPLLEPEWQGPVEKEAARAEWLRDGCTGGKEILVRHKDGRRIWCRTFAKKITVSGRECLLLLAEDITDRKRAEEALRVSEDKYRGVITRANYGILMIRDGIIRFANPKSWELYGGVEEDIVGRFFLDFVAESEQEKIRERYRRRVSGEEIEPACETVIISKGGEPVDVELTAGIIALGGANTTLVFVQDIRGRRKMEKVLDRAKRKLNLLNNVTLNEIGSDIFALSLYQTLLAEARAEGTDAEIDPLLENQKTLLQKISDTLSFAQVYQDLGIKPARWQNVEQIFLISLSHLDSLRIRHDIRTGTLEIFADPLLEQVFWILADNVLTHARTAGCITLRHTCAPDGSLTLFFEDDGIGIAEENKKKIFQPGFQKVKIGDLYLVREVLEITDMEIQETGIPGKGSRFEIRVPEGLYRFLNGMPE